MCLNRARSRSMEFDLRIRWQKALCQKSWNHRGRVPRDRRELSPRQIPDLECVHPNPGAALGELHRFMMPGGALVFTYYLHSRDRVGWRRPTKDAGLSVLAVARPHTITPVSWCLKNSSARATLKLRVEIAHSNGPTAQMPELDTGNFCFMWPAKAGLSNEALNCPLVPAELLPAVSVPKPQRHKHFGVNYSHALPAW